MFEQTTYYYSWQSCAILEFNISFMCELLRMGYGLWFFLLSVCLLRCLYCRFLLNEIIYNNHKNTRGIMKSAWHYKCSWERYGLVEDMRNLQRKCSVMHKPNVYLSNDAMSWRLRGRSDRSLQCWPFMIVAVPFYISAWFAVSQFWNFGKLISN